MKNKILITLIVSIFLLQIVSALDISPVGDIYLDRNVTYPLVLITLDSSVWNITLSVNGTSFNFTWTGTQYNLNLKFIEIGNYPFVINSTEVNGSITGNFLVRDAYEVTFRFFKDKQSLPFFSNKYINEMSYVTAELTQVGTKTKYNDVLEPFVVTLANDNRDRKPVWSAPYRNGVATLKLYEKNQEYAVRLVDGNIVFPSEYSVPNMTESYGINAYIGRYIFNGNDISYDVFVSSKDLHPYSWLLNTILVIAVIVCVIASIFLFFMLPQYPLISLMVGVGFTILFIVIRIVIFVWQWI